MSNLVATNRRIGVAGLSLCILLCVLALPGWWYLRHHRVPGDSIVRTQVLRPGLTLYVVRRVDHGAVVPLFYDYYLSGRVVDADTLGSLMDRRAPFLITDSERATVGADHDDQVCVALRGHVYGFANRVVLDIGGVRESVAISIDARPMSGRMSGSSEASITAQRDASDRPNGQGDNEGAGGAGSVCKMQP